MNNLSVKKQYIIINAIMCFVVAVIAIACITFTSMPTRPTTAVTADNDIPLSDTSYNGDGLLCGINLFNKNAAKHPYSAPFDVIGTSIVSNNCDVSNAVCMLEISLKLSQAYIVNFEASVDIGNPEINVGIFCDGINSTMFFTRTRVSTINNDFQAQFSLDYHKYFGKKIYLGFYIDDGQNVPNNTILTVTNFQISQGSYPLPYEPYLDNSANIAPHVNFDYSIFNRNLRDTCIIGGFSYSRNFEYILTLPTNFMSGINTADSLMIGRMSADGKFIREDIYHSGVGASHLFSIKEFPYLSSGEFIILYYDTNIGGNNTFTVNDCQGITIKTTYLGNIDSFYDTIYKEGYDMGNADGHGKGYTDGRKFGYNEGYTKGMNDGSSTWDNLFPSIFGAIGGFFKNMLDINILGMNLLSILGGIGAIIISLVLIHMVVK